jgi:hypothetical protein
MGNRGGEALKASKRSLQTHAGRHLSNPRLYKATMYMRDSEGTCFVDSAPMAICMIEASNAFLSLLSVLLAHDRLDLTDMTSDVAISTSACDDACREGRSMGWLAGAYA